MTNKSASRLIPRTLVHVGWRYLQGHPWQTILMVVGIMLGVGVMIGVDMANQSAGQAFELSTKSLTGRATHFISGGSQGIPEKVYINLRRDGLAFPAAPTLTAFATSPQLGGLTLQILGVDPFAEPPFRDYLSLDRGIPVQDLTAFLTTPGGVLITQEQAARYNLEVGNNLQLETGGTQVPATIVGLLQPEDALSRRALNGMLLMDIATAQEITGKIGIIDRIDLILPDDDPKTFEALKAQLPAGNLILPTAARDDIILEMTRAFQVNLTALSLLAMVVALFLIYNAMTFSITQRRPLFGILRSLGVTRREIFTMVVFESLVIGVAGAVLGTLLGIFMGRGTVKLVTQTINDLFFVTTVRDLPIPVISLVKGNLLGVVATTITAAFPAWEATRIPPRNTISRSGLESKARKVIPWVGFVGAALIFAGAGVLMIPTKSLVVSFGATFLVMIGMAMLTPIMTVWMMSAAKFITQRLKGPLGRMAPREVVIALSRTSIAISALMVAVAVTIGVSLMINSFRSTVVTWLDQILHGDIYVSVPGVGLSQPIYPIQSEVISLLENWDGIARVDLLQTAVVDSPQGPIQISANNNPNDGLEQIYLANQVPPEQIWNLVQQGHVLVSEPLANRLSLPRYGGVLELNTDRGLVKFPLAGIYYDYTSAQGNAILSLNIYRQYWQDDRVSAAAIMLEPGADLETTILALGSELSPIQSLLIRPNQALKADTLEIFDRTFAITSALQMMTTIVAFVGVLSAMMSLQLDKRRQLAILRVVGMTPKQLWTLVILETGLMGVVAGLLAMPTGYTLALILIYIINRRSFGWTLQMMIEPGPFLMAIILAVTAATLAAIPPTRQILSRNTAEAVRYD